MAMENVTVVGSGIMGRGIAHVRALGEGRVTRVDTTEEILLTTRRSGWV